MDTLVISLSEAFHTLISVFTQRNPLKHKAMSIFYVVSIISIIHLLVELGTPTYISQLFIFIFLLTSSILEPSDDRTDKMVDATILATLPYINIQLDDYIQTLLLSNVEFESPIIDFIVTHIAALFIIITLTRIELALIKMFYQRMPLFSGALIPFFLSIFFFFIYQEISQAINQLFGTSTVLSFVHLSPFLAVPFLIIFTMLFLNQATNQSQEVAREKEQLKVSDTFTTMMNEQYQEMRQFRHDYKNILLTLEGYIRDQEWQELSHYYYNTILTNASVITNQTSMELSHLSKIQTADIRNLLFTKLAYAASTGVQFSVEVIDTISLNVKRNPLYLVRIIGILIDNAIEALTSQAQGQLRLAVFEDRGDAHIILENECDHDPGDLRQLSEAGYSTKGEGRGLGLANAHQLAKESHFLLSTSYHDGLFTQHLILRAEVLSHD